MINQKFLNALSSLFRETEQMSGTRDFCFLALDSLEKAIEDFSGNKEELIIEIHDVMEMVRSTSPRISLLMFMFFSINKEFKLFCKNNTDTSLSIKGYKKALKQIIITTKEDRIKSAHKLIKHSSSVIQDGDIVLLHDASHSIFDILCKAKEEGKNFSIMLAEREKKKNMIILRFLTKHNFSFQVIPEYLLSYIQKDITKAIFGAVTINSLHEIVCDAGTSSIVSQLKQWNIPIYVPITTDKFSLWDAKEHHSYKTKKHKINDGIEYDKLSFSHDRYPTNSVDFFITNKGILTAEELNTKYDQYFSEQKEWRKQNHIEDL